MSNTTKGLSAPLRVYWDLKPEEEGGLSAAKASGTARELAAMRVFYVVLRVAQGVRDDIAELACLLTDGGVKVTVSFRQPASFPGWDRLPGIDVDLSPADARAMEGLVDRILPGMPEGRQVSVSVVPTAEGARSLGEIFSTAVKAGIRTFNLPNPDLVGGRGHEASFVLDEAGRSAVKAEVEAVVGPLGADARLNVHDLFLHQSLSIPGLSGRIEYAGCQAGDALVYIASDGHVYPCASLPVVIGDLKAATFKEAWSSASREAVRQGIKAMPEECADCPGCAECKGGCRGLAFALSGRYGKDPGCGYGHGG